MRDPASVAQQQQARQQDLLTGLITLPLRFLGVLLGSLLLCLLIELIGLHLFWPEQGWRHAQAMMNFELQQLSNHFTRSLLAQEPVRTASQWVAWGYNRLLLDSHLLDAINRIKRLHPSAQYLEGYVLAIAYSMLTFVLRLWILILTLPLFALAALAGLVDGLVRRDLRRFSAGRESGFLFHRARATLLPLAILPWVVYLALPVSVQPLLILLPAAVLLGVAVDVTAGSFKKHL